MNLGITSENWFDTPEVFYLHLKISILCGNQLVHSDCWKIESCQTQCYSKVDCVTG